MSNQHPPIQVKNPEKVLVQRFKSTDYHPYDTITRDHFENIPVQDIPLSPYGGRTDQKLESTGYFRVEKLEDAWTLVDPEGHPFLCLSMNFVRTHEEWGDTRYSYPGRFASKSDWVAETFDLLRNKLGFNTLGNWSEHEAFQENKTPIPYVFNPGIVSQFARKLGILEPSDGPTHLTNQVLPAFHPDLPEHVDSCFKKYAHLREDPWLIGAFSDNEIPFYERKILSRFLSMGENDSSTLKAREWLAERGLKEEDITEEHDREFLTLVMDTYLTLVRNAMDKYLPNHLYLGTRFHMAITSQLSAYKVMGKYADVISTNLYHRWTPNQAAITEWTETAGKPIMFTEWYAKGNDSGMRNRSGAGLTVHTQKERGMFYQNFTLNLLRNPNVVGWHWFRYMDEPPVEHGEGSTNKGLVNSQYDPYPELADAMGQVNHEVYALRDALLNFEHPNLPNTSPVVPDPQPDEITTEFVE
jgi:hypothetical protein